LRDLLRPFAIEGWTIAGLLWALDHLPNGSPHVFAWSSSADLCSPTAWLAWRLRHWRTGDAVLPDPVARR
jgi:hypothetical protein